MRRGFLFSFSILFVVVFCLGLLPSHVGAVSYYNWIRNSSFEYNVNLIEDDGFESNSFNSGLIYGNWSEVATNCDFSSVTPRTGVYKMILSYNSHPARLMYNFSEPILGADVEEFVGYVYGLSGADYSVYIYYSDYTSDSDTGVDVGVNTWVQEDWLSLINDAKYVVAFEIREADTYTLWLDDFVFSVYDSDNDDMQLTVNAHTYPWWLGISDTWDFEDEIVSDHSNTGANSFKSKADGSTYPLYQVIDWVDSDSVHFAELYLEGYNGATADVYVSVSYADGGSSQKHVEVTATGDFEQINFGNNWIQPNRVIDLFVVWLADASTYSWYLDDIALWCDVPLGMKRFDYTIVPSPLSGYNGYEVSLYYGVTYQFYGDLYGSGGVQDENGTFYVTHDKGVTNGTISMGEFNFVIASRSGSSDTYETFGITMNTGSEVVATAVVVHWVYSGSPPSQDDTDEEDLVTTTTDFWNYIVFFMIVFAPPAIVGGAGSKEGWGAQGFLVTLGLTTVAGVMYLGLPFYVIFLVGMGMAIMLFAMLKRS